MKTIWHSCVPLVALLTAALFMSSAGPILAASAKTDYFVYIGTYTGKQSKGIYLYRFQEATGKITALGLAAATTNPTFLAVGPRHRFLYAANETARFDGKRTGSVSSYAIDPTTGKLTFLNEVPSGGTSPCHLVVDRTGRFVLVANYGSGSVTVFPIRRDGSLGEATTFIQHTGHSVNPRRQEGPHAHCVRLSADNRFALVADLGLDKVMIYRFDDMTGSLTPNDPPYATVHPGSGPRHIAFHPSDRFVYVVNEMGSSITAFDYDAGRGSLSEIQAISTLPRGFSGDNTGAEIEVGKEGRFVYASNRGDNSIAVFAINQANGKLTPVEYTSTKGKVPRNFAIDPTGSFLFAANQNSDNVFLFRVDQSTGKLTPTGEAIDLGSPVCVTFVPAK